MLMELLITTLINMEGYQTFLFGTRADSVSGLMDASIYLVIETFQCEALEDLA